MEQNNIMKEITIKQSGTNLTHILVTSKTRAKTHTPLSACERLVYADALFAGCAGKTRQEFLNELKLLGSQVDLNTYEGYATLSVSSIKSKLTPTLSLIEKMLSKPNFDSKEITRIKKLLINELLLSKENARIQADRNFKATLIKKTDSRYPFSTDELLKNISSVKRSALVKLHKEILNSSWSISFSGNTASVNESKEVFKRLNPTTKEADHNQTEGSQTVTLNKNTVFLENIPSKQNIEFNIGNTIELKYGDDDYPAFVFGMSVLSLYGGFSGRLMSTVREKEGLTYGIYGHVEHITKESVGTWRISTFFAPEQTKQGLESTIREIRKMGKNGITEKELVRFKSILKTRQILLNDSMIKKTVRAHGLLLRDITEGEYDHFRKEIQNLTKNKVNEVMKKYINPDILVVSAAGPTKNVKDVIKKLFS